MKLAIKTEESFNRQIKIDQVSCFHSNSHFFVVIWVFLFVMFLCGGGGGGEKNYSLGREYQVNFPNNFAFPLHTFFKQVIVPYFKIYLTII